MKSKATKDKLKYLVENWETKSTKQISEALKVPVGTIRTWAWQLRKLGVGLSRKSTRENSAMFKEFVAELKKKK
jgi:transposase